jgi:hypothetical protein
MLGGDHLLNALAGVFEHRLRRMQIVARRNYRKEQHECASQGQQRHSEWNL